MSVAQAPVCNGGSCFYYVGASQAGITATGAVVSITQAQPVVGASDSHSLTELAVESADGQQIVEVGWIVAQAVNGDSAPHLFVFHWVNGVASCYNACGFVSTPGTFTVGQTLPVGVVGKFTIHHSTKGWITLYNGSQFGYFPNSLWGGTFTNPSLVQIFGEVASSPTAPPTSQMGNGILGSSTSLALIKSFSLEGSVNTPALSPYLVGDATIYNYGFATSTGLHYGDSGH